MEFPTRAEARAQESGYRSGYRQGFAEALTNVRQAIDAGVDPRAAVAAISAFHDVSIIDWSRGASVGVEPPPRFKGLG